MLEHELDEVWSEDVLQILVLLDDFLFEFLEESINGVDRFLPFRVAFECAPDFRNYLPPML